MRVHEAFWVFAIELSGPRTAHHLSKRSGNNKAADVSWLRGHTGQQIRSEWLNLPAAERARRMYETPDSDFPLCEPSGILDGRSCEARRAKRQRAVKTPWKMKKAKRVAITTPMDPSRTSKKQKKEKQEETVNRNTLSTESSSSLQSHHYQDQYEDSALQSEMSELFESMAEQREQWEKEKDTLVLAINTARVKRRKALRHSQP